MKLPEPLNTPKIEWRMIADVPIYFWKDTPYTYDVLSQIIKGGISNIERRSCPAAIAYYRETYTQMRVVLVPLKGYFLQAKNPEDQHWHQITEIDWDRSHVYDLALQYCQTFFDPT